MCDSWSLCVLALTTMDGPFPPYVSHLHPLRRTLKSIPAMAGAQRTVSRDSREREKEFEYMFSFPFYGWETEAGRDQFTFLRSENSAMWGFFFL